MCGRFALTAFLSGILIMAGCAGISVNPMAGKPAPDFTVGLSGGGEASLSQFKGRPLVLGFGASWCPHCKDEIPSLKANFDRYGDRVGILIVVIKSPEAEVAATMKKYDIRFMVGLDPDGDVARLYGVKPIPDTFFIDANGVVVDEHFGGLSEAALADRIERLLGGR